MIIQFYRFKTSGDLCWFEMGCCNTELSMLRIPQLDLLQKHQDQAISSYGNMYTIQSRRPKTKKLWKSHRYKFYKNIETTPKSSK